MKIEQVERSGSQARYLVTLDDGVTKKDITVSADLLAQDQLDTVATQATVEAAVEKKRMEEYTKAGTLLKAILEPVPIVKG